MRVRQSVPEQRRDFPYAGIAVFALFFGVSLLDAIRDASALRILFWIGMGFMFLVLDGVRVGRRRPPGN